VANQQLSAAVTPAAAADPPLAPIEALVRACRDADRAGDILRVYALAQGATEEIAPGLAVTVSVGCAQWRDGEALDELARRADEAMYASKRAGRDQVGSA
jgi:PleD family two-component response regulator